MDSWLVQQATGWWKLRGSTISAWDGLEEAIDEGPAGAPRFAGPELPFTQLRELGLSLGSGKTLAIRALDPGQGFSAPRERALATPSGTMTRRADLSRMPCGRIADVEVRTGRNDDDVVCITEIVLVVEGARVLIVAGELWEGVYHWMDESVLLFSRAEDADEIPWSNGWRPWEVLSEGRG